MTSLFTHTTTYKEPTYHLHLSPKDAPQALRHKRDARPPCKDLDALVTEVMQERFGDKKHTPKAEKQLRAEIAHSLSNRPDQKCSLKIQLPLARAQGLVAALVDRLKNLVPESTVDLTPIAELAFQEENFGWILDIKLKTLFPQNPELRNSLFNEVLKFREELSSLTESTMKFYRPIQSWNRSSYMDHNDKPVVVSQTIASSFDKSNPNVQNCRLNLDINEHVIYSTGRLETEEKAYQALVNLIYQTFVSDQAESLTPREDGSYLCPVVIENLIGSSPFAKKEREYLLAEDEVLKSLSGKKLQFTLPSGETVTVEPLLMHFSTQANYNLFFGQSHRWTSTGSDVGERITDEGTQALIIYYRSLGKPNQAVEDCLKQLKSCTKLEDRLMLRAFICEMLDIPYHVHCKSSKDRTAGVAAIKKALHQWLRIEALKSNNLEINPVELFNNPVFREYSEAALFENLPLTDQGVGFSGVLDGRLHTQDRGFSFQKSLIEHSLPTRILSTRHLHKATLVERVMYTAAMSLAAFVAATVCIVAAPIVLAGLRYKFKKDYLEVYKYLLLNLVALPILSGTRQYWIDRDSKTLQERRFLLSKTPKRKHYPKIAVTKI